MIKRSVVEKDPENLLILGTLVPMLLVILLNSSCGAEERQFPPVSKEEALHLGERMYREGILPSGKPMEAVTQGDIIVTGKAFTCVSCHLRSGLGSLEGGVLTPPTDGQNLFRPRKRFYKGVEVTSEPPLRPAYTDESLAEVLRVGRDPSGRILAEAMPRYMLQDEDMAVLISYLKSLSSRFSPGASDAELRFATVISEDVAPEDRKAMLAPLEEYVRANNSMADSYERYTKQGRATEATVASQESAYKRLSLSVWLLKGPPGTWRGQLEDYYQKEPVFALLGGMAKGEWRPVHEFSEDHRIPCILPITDLPVISETDWYTLYFSKGLYQEGESTARYLNGLDGPLQTDPVVQIVRESPEGLALSAGFQKTWKELGHGAPLTLALKRGEKLTGKTLKLLRSKKPGALIIWDGPDTLQTLQTLPSGNDRPGMVFLSSGYLGESIRNVDDKFREFVYITYPIRLPTDKVRSVVESSFLKGGNARQEVMILLKMFTAVRILTQALRDIRGQYYRDNLLDVIGMSRSGAGMAAMGTKAEDETYPLYERFSFGPGQRYASKGCYIVQLTKGPNPELIRKSEWVEY